jgi:hypothetical protein
MALVAALGTIHCSPAEAEGLPPCSPDVATSERCVAPRPAPHLEVVDEDQSNLPVFIQGGRRFVRGDSGERYLLRLVNPTGERVEAVVSVDGLDAVDGRPASLSKRGYIVPAYGDVVVDGWRTSLDTVASFRFSSVHDSYAGRTGHPRNVGVIGVAFFRERASSPPTTVWRTSPQTRPSAAPSRGEADEESSPSPPSASPPAPHAAGAAAAPKERSGLGTEFGETQDSHVEETTFVRASARPTRVEEIRYDDREGLLSRGIVLTPPPDPRRDENALRDSAQSFPETRFAQPPR